MGAGNRALGQRNGRNQFDISDEDMIGLRKQLESKDEEPSEIDLFDVLKAKVLAGETIYFQGPLAGPAFELHIATVERLARETESAINVTYVF